jgi:hypothetical protein
LKRLIELFLLPVVGGVAGVHTAVVDQKWLLSESKEPVRQMEKLYENHKINTR